MGSSSPDTVKQTTTSAPWSQQIPYLTAGFQQAQNLFNTPGPAYYPNPTVAPFAPETLLGLNAQAARASAGNPVNAAAQGYAKDVLGGRYLTNPYGDAVFQDIRDRVTPAIDSQFSLAGRYGPNAAMTDQLTRSLTDAYAPFAQQQYQSERANQQAIAGLAPTLANTDYQDIAAMTDVGRQRQAQAQSEIQAAMDRYNYNANLPANKLAQYMQLIQGNYGGSTTSKQPVYQPSLGSQIVGGLSTIGGIGLGLAGL